MAKTSGLTDFAIQNLTPKKGKDGVLTSWEKSDSKAKGLRVYVGVSGAKSFIMRYRLNGRLQKLTLGPYSPDEARKDGKEPEAPKVGDPLTLAAARMLAAETLHRKSRGIDPVAEKRRSREARRQAAENTFEAIAVEYLKRECGMRVDAGGEATFDRSKKRSGSEQYRMLQRQVLPTLGDKPVTEIRKSDIIRLLDRLADGELKNDKGKLIEGGEVAADRCLALVRRILNWHAARSDDFRPPLLKGLARTKASEQARDRILNDEELRIIWKVSGEMEGPFPALVRFLLLTAARRAEAAEMPWSETDGTEWVLPKERNKVKRDLVRPLSEAAREVLEARPRIEGSKFVFTTDGRRPLAGYSKPKARFDEAVLAKLKKEDPKAEPLENWTLHDLRRTARSLMGRAGVPERHAEQCLGHVITGVQGIYDRHKYIDEMRIAYEKLAAQIEVITNPPTGNVVPLRGSER
jgi:integrase